jgi:hypothetical protein
MRPDMPRDRVQQFALRDRLAQYAVHSGRRKGRLILRKNDRSDFQNCLISTDQIGEY